jgi:hypothetical protein
VTTPRPSPETLKDGGKAMECGPALARLTAVKLDARRAAGETLDKIASMPIT